MIKLVFPRDEFATLAARFRKERLESFAIVLARPVPLGKNSWRLLVESVNVPTDDEYKHRSETAVEATSAFRLKHETRARRERLSIIYCHSHPSQEGQVRFSSTDDTTERPLAAYAAERVPDVPHGALVIGAQTVASRLLGKRPSIEVWQVGTTVERFAPTLAGSIGAQHDRQIRAFGKLGQRAVQSLRIAVVGCGGTGSLTIQQLAYLGVHNYLLIDPDRLDRTNLNRVVGATKKDVGKWKVKLAERLIKKLIPNANVQAVKGDILEREVGQLLKNVDLVLCCTDSHGSRHFLNQLVHQYYVPVIDMGVCIDTADGGIADISGQARMLAPGLRCLYCIPGKLDPQRVRWDLQHKKDRKKDPYFIKQSGIKQPAVISLNGTVASQAVTLLLAAVAGVPIAARSVFFRGLVAVSKPLDTTPKPGCFVCSPNGYLGKGEALDLPERSLKAAI
jgi:molybdopterin-synthase adenylyltransferase